MPRPIFKPLKLAYESLDVEEGKGRFYRTPEGKRYPSITTVLGARGKEYIHEWRKRVGEEEANKISRFAAGRGNGLHSIAEKYLRGEEDYAKKAMPHVQALFNSIRPHIDEMSEVHILEAPLYSDFLGVAGRCDCAGVFRNMRAIIDFKTARRAKLREDIQGYFMQACSYSIMLEERTRVSYPWLVIMLGIDDSDKSQVFIERRDDWFPKLSEEIIYYRNHHG